MASLGDGPAQVAAALRSQREPLLQRWCRRVLDDPAVPEANRLTIPALRDHVPTLIDRIADAVDRCARGRESAESAGRKLGDDAASVGHAMHRHEADYDLPAAMRELSHLRIAINEALAGIGVVPDPESQRVIAAALDEAMTTAALEMHEAALAELHRAQDELVREGDLRERFTAVLAHDLRGPLQTIVLGAKTMLQLEVTTEGQTRTLLRMLRGAERMASMVDELLDVARIRKGSGIPVHLERANLRDALDHSVEEVEALVPGATIEVSGPASVLGRWDAQRLTQAASNLVRNAVEHGPDGGPIGVRLSADATYATFEVTNPTAGRPIPASAIPDLFEPFRRGHAGSRGLGLGLYIACAIIRAHGGTLVVHSDDVVTRFTVTIPREPPEPA